MEKVSIAEIINRMVFSIDTKDWQACRHCFTDQPFIDFFSISGSPGTLVAADKLVNSWADQMSRFKMTMHFLSNYIITSHTDHVHVNVYAHSIHKFPDESIKDWEVFAHYDFELKMIGESWKITTMIFHLHWQYGG